MFNLNKMSFEELQNLYTAVGMAMDERRDNRRQELIQNVCDAMNALASEFPNVELPVAYHCAGCSYEDEEDVLYVLCQGRQLTPDDFVR